ncbi:MAG: hypothetical protein A2X11_09745 [Bacteroidetes bacterium GWE2_42_24]|nr:MAG: hypothetical protein A2X11_09745 [Bacteroidetes bacterium GWE2_42_24]OFY26221.1 MAG: hypothetical protein A2X09_05400 [Bacteroidetes bacterium GWF2_43_11]
MLLLAVVLVWGSVGICSELPSDVALADQNEEEVCSIERQLKLAMEMSDTTQAYQTISKGLARSAQIGREDMVYKAHMAMGRAAFNYGHFVKALTSVAVAQEMAISSKNWGGVSEAFYLKALIYAKLKNETELLSSVKGAAEYIDDIHDDSLSVVVASFVARVFFDHQQFKSTYEISLKGLSFCKAQGQTAQKALFLNFLGAVCDEWGLLLPALEFYQKSEFESRKSGDSSLLSMSYNNSGLLYKKLHRFDEALSFLMKSMSIDKQRNDTAGLASVYNNLGILWLERGVYSKALLYMQLSYNIVRDSGDSTMISTAYNNFGDIYFAMGKMKQAYTYSNLSVEIDQRGHFEPDLSRSLQTRGRVLASMGRYEDALGDFQRSERLCLNNRLTEDLADLYKAMSDLFHLMGNHALAFDYLQKNNAILDTIFNERLMNQSIWISVEKNMVEKQKEIERLRVESRQNAQELAEKQKLIYRQEIFQYSLIFAVLVAVVFMVLLIRSLVRIKLVTMKLKLQNVDVAHQKMQLEEAIEKGKEADRLKDNFLAAMNHELRTPLNGIIGFAEILENELVDVVHAEMAQSINQSGNRLMTTLNGLLNISQIERNMVEVNYTIFSLTDMVASVVDRHRSHATDKGISFEFHHSGNPIRVSSDETLIERVIDSLVDNAIKYTMEGSILVSISGVKSSIGYQAIIKVKDTGIGIDTENLELIFQQFRQVSEGLVREYEGTGLGLSLCRSYLTLLGGDLKVSSRRGVGSEFTAVLSALWEDIDKPEGRFTRRPVTTEAMVAQEELRLVLLVEDDDINREFALYTLTGYYNVIVATTALMAISLAEKYHFAALLLDINLGRDMSGIEVLHAIRKMDGYQKVPATAVTANALKGERERLLSSGFNYYLSKPYSRKDLLALMSQMLPE